MYIYIHNFLFPAKPSKISAVHTQARNAQNYQRKSKTPTMTPVSPDAQVSEYGYDSLIVRLDF